MTETKDIMPEHIKPIQIRPTPEQREHVEGEAKKLGGGMGNYIRLLINNDMEKKLAEQQARAN